jgi:lysophospholipase L1-like esterase
MQIKNMVSFVWSMVFLVFLGISQSHADGYPDPTRQERWIKEFEKQDAQDFPAPGGVVCIGSSSIRGWHEDLAEDLAPLPVIPRGFGGSNMKEALYYADRIVIPYKPRAVLLYEGDNDVADKIAPETIRDTFLAFVDKVHAALPETRIYCISIKPSISRFPMWPRMEQANQLLKAACDQNDLLTYIDVATPMLNEKGEPKSSIFKSDNLHMNREGYLIWRDHVRPVLHERELSGL